MEQAGGLCERAAPLCGGPGGMPSHVLAGVALLAAARLVRRHPVHYPAKLLSISTWQINFHVVGGHRFAPIPWGAWENSEGLDVKELRRHLKDTLSVCSLLSGL